MYEKYFETVQWGQKKKKPHKTATADKAVAGGKISFRNEQVRYKIIGYKY